MITRKTCWYTAIFPVPCGRVDWHRTALTPDQFVQFGYFLGATFQIQDDILNVAGDRDSYGKDFAGDIVEGKRTLTLIHLFKKAAPRRAGPSPGVLFASLRRATQRGRAMDSPD